MVSGHNSSHMISYTCLSWVMCSKYHSYNIKGQIPQPTSDGGQIHVPASYYQDHALSWDYAFLWDFIKVWSKYQIHQFYYFHQGLDKLLLLLLTTSILVVMILIPIIGVIKHFLITLVSIIRSLSLIKLMLILIVFKV